LAASPDGSRIYLGGSFTAVNGASVWRVAALDAATGRLLTNFVPKVSSAVRAIVVTADTVYLGGTFTGVGTVQRSRLAAFNAADGALKSWAPAAEGGQVNALALSPDKPKSSSAEPSPPSTARRTPGYGLGARHVYMENGGQLTFGVWTGQANTITSPRSYNDGAWHQVVATQSAAGMILYVDGKPVGTNPQTQAQDYAGYWRIGGDYTRSTQPYFDGTLDEGRIRPRPAGRNGGTALRLGCRFDPDERRRGRPVGLPERGVLQPG
jgi:hypothetical protein